MKIKSFSIISIMILCPRIFAQNTISLQSSDFENLTLESYTIYKVDKKSIHFYPYVEGLVNTKSYELFLNQKEEAKAIYDADLLKKKEKADILDKKNLIISNIQTYKKTKDIALLEESSKLAGELNVLFFEVGNDIIYLRQNGKYASKRMLDRYIELLELNKQGITYVSPGYQTRVIEVIDRSPNFRRKKGYLELVEEEKSFTDKEKFETGLVRSKILESRTAYIANTDSIIKALNGNFQELSSKVMIAYSDYQDKLLKNEVSEEVKKYLSYGNSNYSFVKNTDNDELYVFSAGLFRELSSNKTKNKLHDLLIKLNYKPYQYDGYDQWYVNTKYYKIEVYPFLYEELNADKSYLKKLDEKYLKIQELRNKGFSYNKSLDNYIRIYRLKRNNMSMSDIKAWTQITKEANLIHKKIFDLENSMQVSAIPLDEKYYSKYQEFLNYITASSNVLGL